MQKILGNCTIEFDREKTAEYCSKTTRCCCEPCKNFHKLVREKYPKLTVYLERFGIDITSPEEMVWHIHSKEKQTVEYTPIYTVNGQLIAANEAKKSFSDESLNLTIHFNNDAFSENAEISGPYFEIYVDTVILPWQIEEPFDDVFSDEITSIPNDISTTKKSGCFKNL